MAEVGVTSGPGPQSGVAMLSGVDGSQSSSTLLPGYSKAPGFTCSGSGQPAGVSQQSPSATVHPSASRSVSNAPPAPPALLVPVPIPPAPPVAVPAPVPVAVPVAAPAPSAPLPPTPVPPTPLDVLVALDAVPPVTVLTVPLHATARPNAATRIGPPRRRRRFMAHCTPGSIGSIGRAPRHAPRLGEQIARLPALPLYPSDGAPLPRRLR